MKLLASIVLAVLAAGPAAAEDLKGVVFLGGTAGHGASGYAGALQALPGGSLGHGLAVRASVNAGRYKYDGGVGRVKASYAGGEVALVQQWSGAGGWVNLAAGARYTDTKLSPFDPSNEREGGRADLALGTDGSRDLGALRLGWFGAWGVFDKSYQGQVRVSRIVNAQKQTVAGLEAGLQGDPSYKNRSVGGFYSTTVAGNWVAQVALGVSGQPHQGARGYASLGFSRVF